MRWVKREREEGGCVVSDKVKERVEGKRNR